MKTYSFGLLGSIEARNPESARRKMGKKIGADPGPATLDVIAEAIKELPDCECEWRGKGTGANGQFVQGDRCPNCGSELF